MRRLSNGKIRRTPAEWRTILGRFEGSGLGRKEFCRREKIHPTSFQRWQRRLAASAQDAFVEVAAPLESVPVWAVEIELADGTILRLRG
jgi:hypothetical protein